MELGLGSKRHEESAKDVLLQHSEQEVGVDATLMRLINLL